MSLFISNEILLSVDILDEEEIAARKYQFVIKSYFLVNETD